MEIDRHVLPVLRAQVEPLGVRVVEADALTLDWAELLGTDRTGRVTGPRGPWWPTCPTTWPCPWSSGSWRRPPRSSPCWSWSNGRSGSGWPPAAGDEAYGAVSVKVAYWATASVVGRVSASVFIPRPRVESVLVRLDRRTPTGGGADRRTVPVTAGYDRLFAVVRADSPTAARCSDGRSSGLVRPEAFEATGIRPTARAEELGLAEWERLAAWRPEAASPTGARPAQRIGR